jgi:hypothetical protein
MISDLLLQSSPGWISHAPIVSLRYTLLHRHATLDDGIQVTHKLVNINAICDAASRYEVKLIGLMPWSIPDGSCGFRAVVDTMVKPQVFDWWGLTPSWPVWSYIQFKNQMHYYLLRRKCCLLHTQLDCWIPVFIYMSINLLWSLQLLYFQTFHNLHYLIIE